MEKIIYNAGNRFENLVIRSLSLKAIYFMVLQVFTVRYLSLLFLIPCELFSGIQKGKDILEKMVSIITTNQLASFLIIILALIIILLIVYVALFNQSEVISKGTFIALMIIQQLSCIFGVIALSIIAKNQVFLFLKIPCILVIFIAEGLAFLTDKILISYSFETKNIFAHKSNSLITYCKITEKVFFYTVFIVGLIFKQSSALHKCFYLIITVIQAMKIKQMIREKYYVDRVVNYLEIFNLILQVTILVEIAIYEFYPMESLKINAFVLWPIVSLFASFSIYSYLNQKTNEYFFKNIEEICEKNEVINYLEAFYTLWKNSESDYYSLIVASIRKNHQYLCRKPKCYCYIANQAQQHKNSISDGNILFFKGYFQEILNFIDKQNKNHDQKFLKILYFKFKIFNNCIKLSRQLHKVKCSLYNHPELSIGKRILQNYIESVYEKYTTTKNDSLKVQLPMELNQTIIKLQKIVFSDIYVKNKKWSNLGKNFCKILDIEDQIGKQIINLREYDLIYEESKHIYKKSLSFNALSLFYYADVAFIHKKVQAIETNIRELRNPVKYREIISNKELAKHILDSRCCLLEMDLSSSESVKVTELSVSNCTQNVKEIFKFDKGNFIGRKIETLFPKILLETQKKFFQKFLNPNEEMSVTEAIDKFFVDKSGHVFEALINLKIVTQDNSIFLMMVIFQKQTKNIMLLNEKGMIENIGETFVTYFGRLYEDIPFSSFFYFDDEYQSMNFTEKLMKDKFFFLNSLELGDDWIVYLESIKSYFKKKKQVSCNKLKSQASSTIHQTSFETKKKITVPKQDKDTCEFLRKEKSELIRRKILTSRELSNIRQTGKNLATTSTAISILSVSLDYKIISYENVRVKVVIIDEVKRKKSTNDQTQCTIKSFHDTVKNKQNRKYEGTLKEIDGKEDEKQILQELENEEEIEMSVDLDEEIRKKKKEKEKEMIMHEASSVQSSIRTSTISYFYMKFVDTCFTLFKQPSAIADKRLNTFTFASLIVAWCLSLLVVGTYIFFSLGLYQIRDIFFADGAVSDNMQLTLFMYNRAMNFKQFKDNTTEFNHIKQAAFFQRDYVYGLQANDLKQFIENETAITKTKFYEYIKLPTTWSFLDPEETPVELESNQFLIYYYRLSQSVEQNILNPSPQSQKIVDDALQLMRVNCPELKRINHKNLWLYQQMSDDSIALLNKMVTILTICHVVLSLIIFFMYYRQKIFRKAQLIDAYAIYKMIPQKVVEFISTYYGFYCQEIQNQKELSKYQTHYDRHPLYLPMDQANEMKKNKSFFSEKKPIFTKAVINMLLIIFFINLGFGLMLLNIQNLFTPIDLMMKNVNSLMDSENYLIEAYLDLKAKFIIEENFGNVEEEFFDKLLESQLSVEVLFNKISVESLELFSNYDENYKSDFIEILITNTCDLVEGQVSAEQLQNCRNVLKLSYISNGVITGMNFFTRRVRELIEELKFKYYQSNEQYTKIKPIDREYILETLKSIDFREIDESMIFMFKMYQATQSRIYSSLEKAIINIMQTSYSLILVQVLLVGLIYPIFLLYNFQLQKFELSQLYVSFLLIPTPLAKLLKTFSARIEQILEYDKNK